MKVDGRCRNGGHPSAGRKKGVGLAFDIKRHCDNFMSEMLMDEAIKYKAIKQLASSIKEKEEDYLYIIENNGMYKIGYSSNFSKRYVNYTTHLGKVNLVYLTKQHNCFELERRLHDFFDDLRCEGEWFDLCDNDLITAVAICSRELIN